MCQVQGLERLYEKMVAEGIPDFMVHLIFEAIKTNKIWTEFIDATISDEVKSKLLQYNFITVKGRKMNCFKIYVPRRYSAMKVDLAG